MPIDQKRINGPEVSIPYSVYIDKNSINNYIPKSNSEKRADGRECKDIRKIFAKVGIISQAKGSAYIEIGKTKVICSVFDPREIPNKNNYSSQGELYCEFKFATFSNPKRKIHQQDTEEKEYSYVIKRALEPAVCRHEFPNFQVDIYALVLENGGSALAAAIMAASLALANASVPMFGLVTASTIAIHDGLSFLDPTEKEESYCLSNTKEDIERSINHGIVVQAIMPQHNQVTEFFMTGSLDLSTLKSQIHYLNTAGEKIYPIMQQCLVKSISNFLKKEKKRQSENDEMGT